MPVQARSCMHIIGDMPLWKTADNIRLQNFRIDAVGSTPVDGQHLFPRCGFALCISMTDCVTDRMRFTDRQQVPELHIAYAPEMLTTTMPSPAVLFVRVVGSYERTAGAHLVILPHTKSAAAVRTQLATVQTKRVTGSNRLSHPEGKVLCLRFIAYEHGWMM